ncbi:30S ribosomal protein S12 methylthiotransferase RimO [Tessaracoccus sp. SD287]|uniref:30S ribosomal protein S12 methylthiotransferase RimO n=1 Tax=Tessaracoccus sp. SD287 TaxID=2782008 RepID=UPI001A97AC6B|nr:30S ribosomal protein S12 methylthiotransferase RimO [Tessaracoccus sp. SD287]
MNAMSTLTNVHLVTLGCARNEVDSEELAGRLEAGGFRLVADADEADAVMVNTCGFVEQAKKDSVDTLLEAADLKGQGKTKAVVAVGCMAERYGSELAQSMPEADAVLGFDSYATIADRLTTILNGGHIEAHAPRDRRTLLPISPVKRREAAAGVAIPGHADLPADVIPATGPRTLRKRLGNSPYSPLKIASGCDRRCSFCAIPRFRGSYLSRTPEEVVEEARWLVDHGVNEVFLVSENSSSYGKDLGDIRLLEKLLGQLSAVDGLDWIRVSYLQPAEIRPTLIDAMVSTDKVVPYFDLSFQHASGPLLRRMRRFGDAESFLGLIDMIRAQVPHAGIRSNVIAGFPGETEQDVEVLKDFLIRARLDVVGVFAYSDEDNTEGATMDGHLDQDLIEEQAAELSDLAAELCAQRAEDRIGEVTTVLVEGREGEAAVGRAEFQGPEVDGTVTLPGCTAQVGDFVVAAIVDSEGVDLTGEAVA